MISGAMAAGDKKRRSICLP